MTNLQLAQAIQLNLETTPDRRGTLFALAMDQLESLIKQLKEEENVTDNPDKE